MFLLLFILWLIMNGRITMEIVCTGAVITALLSLLMKKLFSYTVEKDLSILKKVPLFLLYLVFLIWEIFKANFAVIRIIADRNIPVQPSLVLVNADLKTNLGRFVLANSITLTPGTITIRQEGNSFTVHALDPSMIEGIENGRLAQLIRKMEA